VHINPDHFLETPEGRICTPDRNAEAWKLSFAALDDALRALSSRSTVYLMVGCQASGKSTWARAKRGEDPHAIIFDAILVKKSERRPIVQAAAEHQVPAVAVWLQTPLHVCIDRNARRPPDEVVNERGLRNVFAALEPPECSEGFVDVVVVPYNDA
jgi:predicted kinase